MRFSILTIILFAGFASSGWACDEVSAKEAYEAIKFGDSSQAYCGIVSLFNQGVEGYPVLYEMLSDDTPYHWFCGHSARHMRNDPIKIEADQDLSQEPSDEAGIAHQDGDLHQATVSQVAAYIVIAVELGDLDFGEYCVIYPESERAAVLNEIRSLVGEADGTLLGCHVIEVLSNHGIQFRECESSGKEFIEAESLVPHCVG